MKINIEFDEKKIFRVFGYLVVLIFLIILVNAGENDPMEFGNTTTTTCWIGGSTGNITCPYGKFTAAFYYGDGSGLTGVGLEDTNESGRFNNLTAFDCAGGHLVIGVEDNGTVRCVVDAGDGGIAEGKLGGPPYLYNTSDTIFWNDTFGNSTYLVVGSDTNASTICSGDEALLGNSSCYDFIGREWITPAMVIDIDKEDIETDLNTFVDIAGDIMTAALGINAYLNITQFVTDATTAGLLVLAKARGSSSSPVEINIGDILGEILFKGYSGDSTSQEVGARIYAQAAGTPTQANDMPANLTFATSPDNSQTPVDRMWIGPEGNVTVVDTLIADRLSGNLAFDNLDTYPSGCSAGQYASTIGDSLTCSVPDYTVDTSSYVNCSANQFFEGDGDCIGTDSSGLCGSGSICLGGHKHDIIEDTTPQLGGYLDTNGNAIGSPTDEIENVYVATNFNIYFGNGQEARIYHDGTKLIIVV